MDDLVERAFVSGFLAHMSNPRADPHNEWEASEIRRELSEARPTADLGELERLLRSLLKGDFSSLTIGFNDLHACNYMTAQAWSDGFSTSGGGMQTYNEPTDWVSPEEREKALASNSVWSIQWYPDTPVGFHALYASSLEALINAVAADKEAT